MLHIYIRPFGNPEDAYYVRHVCDTTNSFASRINGTDKKKQRTKAHFKDMFANETNKEWTRVTDFLRKVFLQLMKYFTLIVQ